MWSRLNHQFLCRDQIKQNKAPAQMKEEHLLAKYEQLGKGFIRTDAWIDTLYADVTADKSRAPGYENHGHADEK